MWQRFTERARKVVFYGQEEAQTYGEGYVSTEHLLLGLLREPDSSAGQVLARLDIDLRLLKADVVKQLPSEGGRPSQDMTLTPRAKHVIDLAYDEARNLACNYIGTEHLLLGLIREEKGIAALALAKHGADLAIARGIVHDLLQTQQAKTEESLDASSALIADERLRATWEQFATRGAAAFSKCPGEMMLHLLSTDSEVRQVLLSVQLGVPGYRRLLEKEMVEHMHVGDANPPISIIDLLQAASKEAQTLNQALRPIHLLLAFLKDDERPVVQALGARYLTYGAALAFVKQSGS